MDEWTSHASKGALSMNRVLLAALCLGMLVTSTASAQPQSLIAVLPIKQADDGGLSAGELEELTFIARKTAAEVLEGDFIVMTEDSMQRILKGMGLTLEQCQAEVGDCAVEIGRKMQADYVVTGKIRRAFGKLSLNFKLYNADTGALLGAKQVKVKKKGAFEARMPSRVAALLLELQPTVRKSRKGRKRDTEQWMAEAAQRDLNDSKGTLFLRVGPAPVKYRIAGSDVSGVIRNNKPLVLELPLRMRGYQIVFSKNGYASYEAEVQLSPEIRVADVIHTMTRNVRSAEGAGIGVLDVRSSPVQGAEIEINGVLQRERTPWTFRVPTGPLSVRVRREKYLDYTTEVVLETDPGIVRVDAILEANFGELVVKAEPRSAEIHVNNVRVGAGIYRNDQQDAGAVEVRVKAPRYKEFRKSFFMEAATEKTLVARLKPQFQTVPLSIVTETEGAGSQEPRVLLDSILLEGLKWERTPAATGELFETNMPDVLYGEHTLEVQMQRFEIVESQFQLSEHELPNLEFELEARFGTLIIDSKPAGSEVYVDGALVGTTQRGPVKHHATIGTLNLEVRPRAEHLRPWKKTLIMSRGKRIQKTIEHETMHGALTVSTNPPDARVLVNGVEVGTSPIRLPKVRTGRVDLEAKREGFTPMKKTIRLAEGANEVIVLELQKFGSVEVHCLVPDPNDRVTIQLGQKTITGRKHLFEGVSTGRHDVTCSSSRNSRTTRVFASNGDLSKSVINLADPTFILEEWKKEKWPYTLSAMSLIGAGIVGTIVGAVFYDEALKNQKTASTEYEEFLNASSGVIDEAYEQVLAAQELQESNETTAWIAFGASGALVLGGITAILLSPDPPEEIRHLVEHGPAASPSTSWFITGEGILGVAGSF